MDDPASPAVRQLVDIFDSMDLQQVMTNKTHRRGHILDLVITRHSDQALVRDTVSVDLLNLSDKLDHHPVVCSLHLAKDDPKRTTSTYRNYRSVDCASFAVDVSDLLSTTDSGTEGEGFDSSNRAIAAVVDKHAPTITHTVRTRIRKPWYNAEIHAQRLHRRKLERRWIKTKLTIDKDLYLRQCAYVVTMIQEAKSDVYKDKLESASPRDMFRVVNGLIACQDKTLPSRASEKALAEECSRFFNQKVATIRAGLDASDCVYIATPDTVTRVDCQLSSFTAVTDSSLRKIIKQSPSKSCQLDPVPTWLVKDSAVIEAMLPTLVSAVNGSLESGVVPATLKTAVVTPLIKKTGLDLT